MGSLAFRMVRVFPTVDRSATRELRKGSSRRQERFRSEVGQSAVEFALVVPLLLLVIIAILHFGKVMNYWLDLNHVASEGARMTKDARHWGDAEQALLDALTQMLGAPSGNRGRSREA